MSGEIFTKPRVWYETRSTCFDAEAGYNYLTRDGVDFHDQGECERIEFTNISGRCLGVFVDVDSNETLAAYIATNEGVFLVKNPMELDNCAAGKTNALRYGDNGVPELYYHKNGVDWSFARVIKTSTEQGEDDVDVFELTDDFPGIHYIKSPQTVTLEAVIPQLESFGYVIPVGMSLLEILDIISAQPYSGKRKGFSEILEKLTNLYIEQNRGDLQI